MTTGSAWIWSGVPEAIVVPLPRTCTSSHNPSTNGNTKPAPKKLTDEQKKRLEHLIKSASSLAEVQKLEKAMNEGRMPAGVMDAD